jgi:hypothetical protein
LEFRKALGKVYDLRSRVVHGELVDMTDVTAAAEEAITVGLKAIRELYTRPHDLRSAKSGDRADRLILAES